MRVWPARVERASRRAALILAGLALVAAVACSVTVESGLEAHGHYHDYDSAPTATATPAN